MAKNSSPSSSNEPTTITPSPSLKQKGLQRLKSLKLQTCFYVSDQDHQQRQSPPPPTASRSPRLERWKSSSERAKNYLSSKFGSGSRHRRRYSSSGEMKYDATSYALNFDDGIAGDDATQEELLRRNFSARLPASPPRCA